MLETVSFYSVLDCFSGQKNKEKLLARVQTIELCRRSKNTSSEVDFSLHHISTQKLFHTDAKFHDIVNDTCRVRVTYVPLIIILTIDFNSQKKLMFRKFTRLLPVFPI